MFLTCQILSVMREGLPFVIIRKVFFFSFFLILLRKDIFGTKVAHFSVEFFAVYGVINER